MTNYCIFDTETTGFPKSYSAPVQYVDNLPSGQAGWPRIVQLAWLFCDDDGDVLAKGNHIIKPDGFMIPDNMVHGITTKQAIKEGVAIGDALADFLTDLMDADAIICHNYDFDAPILGAEMWRLWNRNPLPKFPAFCTMKQTTEWAGNGRPACRTGRKRISLASLHQLCTGEAFDGAHDAMADVYATARCFFHLKRHSPGVFANPYR